MNTTHKYIIHGPGNALKRLPEQLFEDIKPNYSFRYDSDKHNDVIQVAVFEQYEKQINASVTLTCIFTYTGTKMAFESEKTGGRIGFRGSSLDEEKKTIEDNVIKFIQDYSKRFGLSMQQDPKHKPEENNSEEE